jgi:hypothetical protein
MAPLPSVIDDPLTGLEAIVTLLQPYQARKPYRCPGCEQDIRAGEAHVVVVPRGAADLRRHWHRRCLAFELTTSWRTRWQHR